MKLSKYTGILRPGSSGFQDKFQPFYLHYISAQECITDFQSALKGSSTFVNSYGYLLTMPTSHVRLYTG